MFDSLIKGSRLKLGRAAYQAGPSMLVTSKHAAIVLPGPGSQMMSYNNDPNTSAATPLQSMTCIMYKKKDKRVKNPHVVRGCGGFARSLAL